MKRKITETSWGATLIGSGIDGCKYFMVADKSELDLGIGVCGKEGLPSVPVGVGQPAPKIDEITGLVEQIKSLCKRSQNSIRIGFFTGNFIQILIAC